MYELEKLLMMLLTEGSVSKVTRSWRISFKNKSKILVGLFSKYFKEVFGKEPKNIKTKDGTILVYAYSTSIAQQLLTYSPSYRTKSCVEKPICPEYIRNKEKHLKKCIIVEDKQFHKTQLPESVFSIPFETRLELVKILTSTEGHLVFSKIRGRRPNEIVRQIIITCYHPILRKQFKKLINSCDIKCEFHGKNRIRISGKNNLIKFKEKVGFFPDIIVSKGNVWKGVIKQELLQKMIDSYI